MGVTARALLWLTLSQALMGGDVTALPRDAAKEAWVRTALARLGLNNDIRVARDDALTGSGVCAYAVIRSGAQYVAYDPRCVTTLSPGDPWSAGVMMHEIAHHLGAHTATIGKPTMKEELESERWVGWAFRHFGFTLSQAMVYARGGLETASQTHPGRPERIKAVESGWWDADALLTGNSTVKPLPASSGADVERLAGAARRGLKTLRETSRR